MQATETMQDRIKTLESQIEWQKAGVDAGSPLTDKQAIWLPIAEELVRALKLLERAAANLDAYAKEANGCGDRTASTIREFLKTTID